MAPPHKRRRLTDSSSPSFSHLAISEPSPTLSHTVEALPTPSVALLPRPVPQRIDEVHLQIQRQAAPERHEHRHQQLRRQAAGTAISSALDSTLTVTVLQWADVEGGTALSTINDDLGGTYATTQTLTLVSSPLPSATTTSSSTEASPTGSSQGLPSSTPLEGFIGNSPSCTGPSSTGGSTDGSTGAATGDSSGTASPTSTGPSSAGITAASITASSSANSTRTGKLFGMH